jgi:hypothetical protein
VKLPEFLIIGASKSGTTSLYNWLAQHPRVFMSPIKETNFFAYSPADRHATTWGDSLRVDFPVRSPEDYAALFAAAGEGATIGEASPAYLESAGAADRIRQTLPQAKLVVSLRNPADRAYSGYWMAVRHGHESTSVEDAFGPDEYRVRAGFYHALLKPYFDLFGRERLHVMLFEDLAHRPRAVFRELCRFLGVEDDFSADLTRRHNPGGVPRARWMYAPLARSGVLAAVGRLLPAAWRRSLRDRSMTPVPPMPPELRRRLATIFGGDVSALEELIGRDLSHWLAAPAHDPAEPG